MQKSNNEPQNPFLRISAPSEIVVELYTAQRKGDTQNVSLHVLEMKCMHQNSELSP